MRENIREGIKFLEELTRDSADICLVKAEEDIGKNASGVSRNLLGLDVVTPAASKFAPQAYPSFFLTDFTMSIPAVMYDADYLHQCTILFAKSQKEKDWKWYNGFVPAYTPASHINMDGGYCYYPGNYFSDERQGGCWGPLPPIENGLYFIHLVYYVFEKLGADFLKEEVENMSFIDLAEKAFHAAETDKETNLCMTSSGKRAVGFGYTDTVHKIGLLLFTSCLKYRSAKFLSEMFSSLGVKKGAKKYELIMKDIQENVTPVFHAGNGFLYAATEVCRQRDVWGTAFAVYSGVLTGKYREKACLGLRDAYLDGLSVCEGSVRQILVGDDWSDNSAWEYSVAGYPHYQNGGYWLTPSGWYIYAVSLVDVQSAQKMFLEMINHMKETDFRAGGKHKGPYEWYSPKTHKFGMPVNLTSSACPLKAIKRIMEEGLWEY